MNETPLLFPVTLNVTPLQRRWLDADAKFHLLDSYYLPAVHPDCQHNRSISHYY